MKTITEFYEYYKNNPLPADADDTGDTDDNEVGESE